MKNNTTQTEKKQITSSLMAESASQKKKETSSTTHDMKNLNDRFIHKRYSFNGNGNGYQGL